MKIVKPLLVFLFILFLPFNLNAKKIDESIAVSHIVTGDVVNLSNGKTARLLCVDAPEITHRGKEREPFAREAIAFMRKEFEDKKVRLEFGEKIDDGIGRIFVYIYRVSDGMFLNAELIKRGLAKADESPECGKKPEFKMFELAAKNQKLGLWAVKGNANDKNSKKS